MIFKILFNGTDADNKWNESLLSKVLNSYFKSTLWENKVSL